MKRVHDMPFGATVLADGRIRFRLWAPAARRVELRLQQEAQTETGLPMQALADGWFEFASAPRQVTPGARYRYRIDGSLDVPDPASRANPEDVHGYSEVVDGTVFDWHDGDWNGRPWHTAVIYELHVGCFTEEGSFAGVMKHLDYLAALGISAIELMPVADFPGRRNWGYDGVLPFAPDSSYGTPEQLKALVQAAHARGLMVLLDVVYNHFGPDGNYLHIYAPQFFTERHHTPWGAALNFDGEGSRVVRDFFIHNALFWLEEYHFDGLRLDAVHAIADDSRPSIVQELAAAIHAGPGRTRQIHLVLENDDNAARYLGPAAASAQWNDDTHHALHILLTGERDGYFADYADQPIRHLARCLAEGFAFQGEHSPYRGGRPRGEPSGRLSPAAFINFCQTHDQVGNRAFGERIGMLVPPNALKAALAVLLLAPSPPLLFMGEEFAASTPFQYFCDFQGELASAVTEGRRREFSGFREFADAAARARIPDPNDPATFERCRLDWHCLELPQHKAWLAYYRSLLELRRTRLLPRLSGMGGGAEFELAGASGLAVRWRLGDGARLSLLANLGDATVARLPHFAGTPFYFSQENLPELLASGQLPPWSVAWLIEESRA